MKSAELLLWLLNASKDRFSRRVHVCILQRVFMPLFRQYNFNLLSLVAINL